jgi:hypothetical protein
MEQRKFAIHGRGYDLTFRDVDGSIIEQRGRRFPTLREAKIWAINSVQAGLLGDHAYLYDDDAKKLKGILRNTCRYVEGQGVVQQVTWETPR